MTTYFRSQSTCAHCGKPSEHQVLGSTNAFGSPDLDLRPPPMKRSTMDAWLQQCPHCGYVAGDIGTPEGNLLLVGTAEYAAVLADERFPELARLFLARAALDAANPAAAGHSHLCAAWVCDDARMTGAAIECRTKAANHLTRTKPFAEDDDGNTRGAVLVDVLRRAGQFDAADAECLELLERTSVQGIVRQVLETQRRFIANRDAAAHTVAEATRSP